MKRIRLPFLSITLALCLLCVTAFASVTSASAHTATRSQVSTGQSALSGSGFYEIDLNQYCHSRGSTGVSLDGSTVYDWHCVDQQGNHIGFSLTYACQWSLNSYWGADRVGNFYDPYSVRCFKGSKAGGLDLNAYCQSLGDTGVSLDGTTVYDWHCVDQKGNHVSFSPTAACQWQWGTWAFDRFGNFYDATSIQCWGFGIPV